MTRDPWADVARWTLKALTALVALALTEAAIAGPGLLWRLAAPPAAAVLIAALLYDEVRRSSWPRV